jgi:hypothetical protein
LDFPADSGGARERNLVDLHVLCDRSASSRAIAAQDVDDAGGEACFLDELGDVEGGQGGLFAGFENSHTASGKARTELPCKHEQREVPRDDLAADADRLVISHGQEVAVDGNNFAFDLVRPAGVVAQAADNEVEVSFGTVPSVLLLGLAVVQRLELLEVLAIPHDEVSQPVHEVATP